VVTAATANRRYARLPGVEMTARSHAELCDLRPAASWEIRGQIHSRLLL
jgi:hypothetical protein